MNHQDDLTSLGPSGSLGMNMKTQGYNDILTQPPNKNLTLGEPINCTIEAFNLAVKLTSIGVEITTDSATNVK